MKRLLGFITIGVSLFLLSSCDHLDFEERFEPVAPAPEATGKHVLIEDFTGQRCSNCPLAHAEAEALQERYGQDRIIVVALHGGPQAVDENNGKVQGLANEEGKEYNRRLGTFSYPKGIVDRQGGLLDYEKWNSAVLARLALSPQVELSVSDMMLDTQSKQFSFACHIASAQPLTGRLQIWLTESDIMAVQTLPAAWGGGNQPDYVHHHVFRAAVNGIDGEALPLQAGDAVTKNYTFHLRDHWQPDHLSLVVIYDHPASGVLQVIDAKLVPDI